MCNGTNTRKVALCPYLLIKKLKKKTTCLISRYRFCIFCHLKCFDKSTIYGIAYLEMTFYKIFDEDNYNPLDFSAYNQRKQNNSLFLRNRSNLFVSLIHIICMHHLQGLWHLHPVTCSRTSSMHSKS